MKTSFWLQYLILKLNKNLKEVQIKERIYTKSLRFIPNDSIRFAKL